MLYRDAGTGGARGHCPATLQYLADQLTLFQPGDGRLFSPINTLPPPPTIFHLRITEFI